MNQGRLNIVDSTLSAHLCSLRCAVEERSFHGGSRHLAVLLALAYSTWMLVVRQFYGKASLKQSNSCACVWSICVPAAAASSHHRRCC